MLWLIFALATPLVWAITNIIDKYALSKLINDAWLPMIIFSWVGAVASLIIFGVHGLHVSWATIFIALVTGVVYCLSEVSYFEAARHEEISRVISLIYLDPLFTALFASLFLKEIFSFAQYLGVVLLVVGAVLISYKPGDTKMATRTIVLCLAGACLCAVNNLLSKYMLGSVDFWSVFALIRMGSFVVLIPTMIAKRTTIKNLITQTPRSFAIITSSMTLNLFGSLFLVIALSLGFATLTVALSALQPLFVLILTVLVGTHYPHILQEVGGKRAVLLKLVAIALMFIGISSLIQFAV